MEDQAADAGLEAPGLQEAHVEQLAPVEEEPGRLLHQEETVVEALGEAAQWSGLEGRSHNSGKQGNHLTNSTGYASLITDPPPTPSSIFFIFFFLFIYIFN